MADRASLAEDALLGELQIGKDARTLASGRRQVNLLSTRKREHSRKPDEQYELIEACSPAPYLELFARRSRNGWTTWGDQVEHALARRAA